VKFLSLPTLKFRKLLGDMIEVFKIINNLYDSSVAPSLTRNLDTRNRGNSLKLKVDRCKYDLKKYSFCNRVVNVWNSLPDSVVMANSMNSFKNKLDNFWKFEEVVFYWGACLPASAY